MMTIVRRARMSAFFQFISHHGVSDIGVRRVTEGRYVAVDPFSEHGTNRPRCGRQLRHGWWQCSQQL